MLLIELTILIANNMKSGDPFTQGRCKQNRESAKVTLKEKSSHPQVEVLTGNPPLTPECRISSHIAPEGSGSSSLLSFPLALQKERCSGLDLLTLWTASWTGQAQCHQH